MRTKGFAYEEKKRRKETCCDNVIYFVGKKGRFYYYYYLRESNMMEKTTIINSCNTRSQFVHSEKGFFLPGRVILVKEVIVLQTVSRLST